MSVKRIDVIDAASEEYAQEVLGFSKNSSGGNPTSTSEPIISKSSSSIALFEGSDFILEEIEAYVKDDSVSQEIDHADYDPEGDICLIKKLLNNDPFQLPPMDIKRVDVFGVLRLRIRCYLYWFLLIHTRWWNWWFFIGHTTPDSNSFSFSLRVWDCVTRVLWWTVLIDRSLVGLTVLIEIIALKTILVVALLSRLMKSRRTCLIRNILMILNEISDCCGLKLLDVIVKYGKIISSSSEWTLIIAMV
nr:reverse transcriptase domain-containing protein [Tanacetum cinerariifolium]